MLRVREILCAASFALALYGAPAAAQPTPATSSSGAPYDDLARRVEELRAQVTGMQCISDDLRREIGAVEGEVLKMNAKFDRATDSKVPLDPDFVKAHDRMTAGVKAIRDAVAKANKTCPPGPRPGGRPVRPPQPPNRPPEQPSGTIVPQPKLPPADVVPPRTTPASESDNGFTDQRLAQRLSDLQEKVRNSYCVTPELQKQVDDLRRDLDKATKGLDLKKPVDQLRLQEHGRMARALFDLDKAMHKLPQACPKTEKISPVDEPPPPPRDDRFPPPTRPLGGTDLGVNCNEKDRTDERLKLQEELLPLEQELIKTDGTTPKGRARQIELQREIKRITDLIELLKQPCPPKTGAKPTKPHGISDDSDQRHELVDITPTSHQNERPPQPTQPSPQQTDHRFPPPMAPLGGKQTAGCTDKERTDERLRLQEEVLKLEGELIRTDGTTPTGRARQTELQREIKYDTDQMERLRAECPYRISSNRTQPPVKSAGVANEFVGGPTPKKVPQPQPARDDCQAAEGIHPCTTSAEKTSTPREVRLTYDDLVHNLAYVKEQRSYVRPTSGELDKRLGEVGRVVESLAAYQAEIKNGRLVIDPDAQEGFFEDINGWLYELLNQIEEQPIDPSKLGRSAVQSIQPPNQSAMPPVNPAIQPVYDMINAERAQLGLPPLERDLVLEQHSQQHANEMREANDLEHATRDNRGDERENIGKGLPTDAPLQVAQRWAAEKKYFRKGMYPDVCYASGPVAWYLCAHYTMMIWATTTKFGCAWARGMLGFIWVDCRFSPGGNKDNRPVGPVGSDVAAQFKGYLDQHPGTLATDREAYFKVLQPGYGNQLSVGGAAGDQPAAKVRQPAGTQQSIDWAGEMGGRRGPSIYALMDFGDFIDDGLSGFIGGGVGVARVDFNNVRTFSNQAAIIEGSDMDFARQIISGVRCADGTQAPVEQPTLPAPDPLEPLVALDPESMCIM